MDTAIHAIISPALYSQLERHIGEYLDDLIDQNIPLKQDNQNPAESLGHLGGEPCDSLKGDTARAALEGDVDRVVAALETVVGLERSVAQPNQEAGVQVELVTHEGVGCAPSREHLKPELIKAEEMLNTFKNAINESYKAVGLEGYFQGGAIDRRLP